MFVRNVENLSSIGHIHPIEENIVRLNAEIKAMQEECLKQTSVVVSQKTAYVVERSSAILNLRLLTESAVQIRAAMNCIVKKSLEKIILNGLEAQRDEDYPDDSEYGLRNDADDDNNSERSDAETEYADESLVYAVFEQRGERGDSKLGGADQSL